MRGFKSFEKDTSGATSIEYAVLISVIALTIFAAVGNYTGVLGNMFSGLANKYEEARR